MIPFRLLFFTISFCLTSYGQASRLDSVRSELHRVFSTPLLQKASFGFYAKSLSTGQDIHKRNEQTRFSTASCMKLVTTAAVLDRWGPSRQFKTELLSEDTVRRGALDGHLYVKGYGDPYLTTEILLRAVYHLKASGLREIKGDLVADASYLIDTPNAETNDRAYSAVGGALGFNFNTIAINVEPGIRPGDTAKVYIIPPSKLFTLDNRVMTTDSGGGHTISNGNVAIRYGKNGTAAVGAYGTIGSDEKGVVIYKRIESPEIFTATVIAETFEQFGIKIRGRIRTGLTPRKVRTVAEIISYDLSAIVAGVNKWSNNYVAGQLLMILGAEDGGAPGTDAKGIAAVKKFLSKVPIAENEIVMVDGAGLDRRNQMTPAAHVRLLEYMYRHFPDAAEFMASLSIGGVDGTEKKRFLKSGGPIGTSRLKIGYLHGVSGLSGYVQGRSGDVTAFAMFTNGFPIDEYESVKRLEDRVCQLLASL